MSAQKAIKLLKEKKKRVTEPRVALLNFLMSRPKAYPLNDIVDALCVPVDRVTIYRALHTFEEIDLVVRMVDFKGVCHYMFKHDIHLDGGAHPHLRCRGCGTIICLPDLPNEYLEKLERFKIEDIYFLMEGLCPNCLPSC
ncbi:Fur family transcriptional regulator [Flexithrix dorotheae]|uniref:Fur family transcriptional regulator n=1 Tax=Flexithrix dorotheae TaxID=70993 RepID=UPI00037B4FCB|nr:transcriptional repressor [Flexithrix dorotheae]